MQRIRNKMLQLKYVKYSIMILNEKKISSMHNLFNYKSLVRFKYYLASRANNVL